MYPGVCRFATQDIKLQFDTASPGAAVADNNLRNPLFSWIMRALMQYPSAYTRRTKLIARKNHESKHPGRIDKFRQKYGTKASA